MKQSRMGKKALAFALLGMLGSGTALGQSLDASETVAVINQTDHNASVVFTNTSPATVGAFDFELTYNDANLTITTVDITTNHAGTSCSVPSAGTILCFSNPTSGLTLPDSVTITLPFDVGTTEQIEPLTFGAVNMFDSGGGGVSPTLDDGQIDVQGAAPDVTLSFNPTGTVVFPGGTSGNTVSAAITVTAGGTVGSGTVTGCGITGANAGAFAVTSGDLSIAAGGSDTIDLTCDLANSDLTATLTCTETDSNSAGTDVSWTLDCGAGDPVPAPEYTSTPAPGSLITCNGAPGSVVNRSIVIENTGFVGDGSADSDLTFSCSVAGAGFALTGTTADTLVVGETATVGIECTVPLTEGTTNTGSVTCTSDDAANSPAVYDLSSGIVTAPPPVPQATVIPANSLWSLLAMFGVLAAIGAVVIGLRRH